MILSFVKDYIFIKTRKTGGTSIQIALSEYAEPSDIITGAILRGDGTVEENYGKGQNTNVFGSNHPHPTVADIKRYVGKSWPSFWKFAIVRDPFDIVVSRYHWDVKGKGKASTSVLGFRKWLKEEYFGPRGAWRNDVQLQYISDPDIEVFKYECGLDEIYKTITTKLHLPYKPLGNYKGGYRDTNIALEEWYDLECEELVAKHFAEDFKRCGYANTLPVMFQEAGPRTLLAVDADNINGPCVIHVPEWAKDRLGNYYMYFSHHQGKYIRFAYSDYPDTGWKIAHSVQPLHVSNTPCITHIASPDVHVNHETQAFEMYFHGDIPPNSPVTFPCGQGTYLATSKDGIIFGMGEPKTALPMADFYFRKFKHGELDLGIAKNGNECGFLFRHNFADQAWDHWAAILIGMRHASVLSDSNANAIHVFYSKIGDAPECIRLMSYSTDSEKLRRNKNPHSFPPLPIFSQDVLLPLMKWEGADQPTAASKPGRTSSPANQLRDPYIFKDNDGELYLYYAGAGEHAIGVVKLVKKF